MSCLPRELVDVSPEVSAVPAPVLPQCPAPYRLRVVDPDSDDPELIAEWMSSPHLVRTWEQDWPASRWRADSAARLAGSYSLPCILGFRETNAKAHTDIGYVELYRVAKDECAKLYAADPYDIGFHIAGGIESLIGRGVYSAFMGVMAAAIWQAEPHCRRIIGDPDHRNVRVHRALEKNGWHRLVECQVRPERRIALYVLTRQPGDLPQPIAGSAR
ncbi:acetyltransferase [Skermania sp. ID1734]|uniref:GNAT family N-acetyltransferase n=1 Tax=Skermania sp. ID1734 TaxID=2597516 RepID=UPI00117F560F|nr:GNAT family N-acetyltransferase [Skermania sp. ID1734]TSE01436.1 acetyltransferase [Skermania sp. ID1734]